MHLDFSMGAPSSGCPLVVAAIRSVLPGWCSHVSRALPAFQDAASEFFEMVGESRASWPTATPRRQALAIVQLFSACGAWHGAAVRRGTSGTQSVGALAIEVSIAARRTHAGPSLATPRALRGKIHRTGPRCKTGCADDDHHLIRATWIRRSTIVFTLSHLTSKYLQKGGGIGSSDPRAGYLFQRSSVPPSADCVRKPERGGAITMYKSHYVQKVAPATKESANKVHFSMGLCPSIMLSLAASWGDCGGGLAPRVPSLQALMVLPCTKQASRLVNNCEWAPHFFIRRCTTLLWFYGALLGCKLGRMWRRPCFKGAKPPRAHGLAMHQAMALKRNHGVVRAARVSQRAERFRSLVDYPPPHPIGPPWAPRTENKNKWWLQPLHGSYNRRR